MEEGNHLPYKGSLERLTEYKIAPGVLSQALGSLKDRGDTDT